MAERRRGATRAASSCISPGRKGLLPRFGNPIAPHWRQIGIAVFLVTGERTDVVFQPRPECLKSSQAQAVVELLDFPDWVTLQILIPQLPEPSLRNPWPILKVGV